jgi:hypothetical protein
VPGKRLALRFIPSHKRIVTLDQTFIFRFVHNVERGFFVMDVYFAPPNSSDSFDIIDILAMEFKSSHS